MSATDPELPIDEKAREVLRRHYRYLQDPSTAAQVWERYLSPEEREQLGGDFTAAYEHGALVGMWRQLYGVSEGRAIIELAHLLGWATDADADWLFDEIGEDRPQRKSTSRPEWNKETGELTFRGKVVRRVKNFGQARNVMRILDAFQEEGWPSRIHDQLDFDDERERLHSTIKSLNDGISRIRFHTNGCGEGIRWSLQAPSAPQGDCTLSHCPNRTCCR